MFSQPMSRAAVSDQQGQFIYICCPWTPKGGGMFKVADYLIQAQSSEPAVGFAQLRPLDSRGGANALYSIWVLGTAVGTVIKGRLSGKLAGVHVNVAERLSLFRKGVIVATCRLLDVPVILHLHAAQLPNSYSALPRPLKKLTQWMFSLPASCVVLGESAKKFVIDELKVPAEKVEIIFNGVPGPQEAHVNALPAREPAFVQRVLFVGNLSERKGVSDLLHALASSEFKVSNVEVRLVGGGDVTAYRNKARELGLDGFVTFAGWADQKQVACFMASADVLVLPSYDEGLPLVILEALAHNVAVVCTPVGEIPQVMTDGLNACFVKAGDVAGIATALTDVLSNPVKKESLGRNGRRLYEEHFSISRFFETVARTHQRYFGISGQALRTSIKKESDVQ